MELTEILERLEYLLAKEKEETSDGGNEKSSAGFLKEMLLLLFQFVIALVKVPLGIVGGYIKNEIVSAVKKDSKLMAVISAMLVVLLIFFFVFYMSLSVAVGVYFYEKENTLFVSVLYSLVFQVFSSLIIGLIAYFSYRNLNVLKVYKSIVRKR